MGQERQPIDVLKLGGEMMGSAQNVHACADRVDNSVVVVSALKGVTNKSVTLTEAYQHGRTEDSKLLRNDIIDQHGDLIVDLRLGTGSQGVLFNQLVSIREQFELYADTIRHTSSSERLGRYRDYILSLGEYMSSHIFHQVLIDRGIQASRVDAYQVMVTDSSYGNAEVDLSQTVPRIRKAVGREIKRGNVPVIPGFYGVDGEGTTTTMPRNSSDKTAAVHAYALDDVRALLLAKGVRGVYDSNPHENPEAQFLSWVSYEDATEISNNGGKVIYPDVMKLMAERQIPIVVFNPHDTSQYTVISSNPESNVVLLDTTIKTAA